MDTRELRSQHTQSGVSEDSHLCRAPPHRSGTARARHRPSTQASCCSACLELPPPPQRSGSGPLALSAVQPHRWSQKKGSAGGWRNEQRSAGVKRCGTPCKIRKDRISSCSQHLSTASALLAWSHRMPRQVRKVDGHLQECIKLRNIDCRFW